jgi:hypothetical protein
LLKLPFSSRFVKIVTWEMVGYIPIHDGNSSQGNAGGSSFCMCGGEAAEGLTRDLYHMFAGWSRAPGLVEGVYKDPNTGQPVADKSRRYVVALPHRELDRLRRYLREVGVVFKQKVIYLSVAGQVEFVEARYEEISDTEAGDV